jgi:hypothetical protein
MEKQSVDYLPCTVAVSSFTPSATVTVTVSGASWSLYPGLMDSHSDLNLLITGAPLGLNNLNITSSDLSFTFSGDADDSDDNVAEGTHGGGIHIGVGDHGPVTPPTITLKLYVRRGGGQFTVSLRQDWPGLSGFTFNGMLYSLDTKLIQFFWPS